MEKKRLKRLPPNWQKMDISRLVSPVSGHLLSSIFLFQPLSGVTSQYRQYLNRVRDSLTHQVFYKHVNVQICTNTIFYSHFFKVNVDIKTPIQAEDCLYLNIFRPHRDTGEISDQYLCQINIYVRSLSLSDQYLCHTNAMGMNR